MSNYQQEDQSTLTNLADSLKDLKEKALELKKTLAQLDKSIEETKQPYVYEVVFNKELKNKEQRDAELDNQLNANESYKSLLEERFDTYYELKELEVQIDYKERLYEASKIGAE
jgi:predicted RNase H-like nuclease (RuvC/YqgF family)